MVLLSASPSLVALIQAHLFFSLPEKDLGDSRKHKGAFVLTFREGCKSKRLSQRIRREMGVKLILMVDRNKI